MTRARIAPTLALALALTGCSDKLPLYPTLGPLTEVEKAMDCARIDVAIDRADTVRWVKRDDGIRMNVGSWWSAPPAESQLDAADARIRGLLQLKRVRGCPPRATLVASMDDLGVLRELESLQAQIDATGWSGRRRLLEERTTLLDQLRLLPQYAARSASSSRQEQSVTGDEHSATEAVAAGAQLPLRMPRAGDAWKYLYTNHSTNSRQGPFVHEIVAVSQTEIRERMHLEGTSADDGLENVFNANVGFVRSLCGIPEFSPYLQAFDVLEKTGQWPSVPAGAPETGKWVFSGKVTTVETLKVPAGTFTATRVELTGRNVELSFFASVFAGTVPVRVKFVLWYAPEVKRVVKYTRETYAVGAHLIDLDSYELLDFRVR